MVSFIPKYSFSNVAYEVKAQQIFKSRLALVVISFFGLFGPIMLWVAGDDVKGEIMNSRKWWSVPILDDYDFKDLHNPFVCAKWNIAGGECPEGERSNWKKTKCYYYHSDPRTYEEAIQACAVYGGVGGTLAAIESQEDNKMYELYCKIDAPCWTGFSRLPGTSVWTWSDGSPVVYKNWGHQQPMEPWDSDDLGAYAVWGYKRWAGNMMKLMGQTAFGMLFIQLVLLGVLFAAMHFGMSSKNPKAMLCTVIFDIFQAVVLLIVLIVAFVGLGVATGAGIVGATLYIFLASLEFVLVSFIIIASLSMRKFFKKHVELPEVESTE